MGAACRRNPLQDVLMQLEPVHVSSASCCGVLEMLLTLRCHLCTESMRAFTRTSAALVSSPRKFLRTKRGKLCTKFKTEEAKHWLWVRRATWCTTWGACFTLVRGFKQIICLFIYLYLIPVQDLEMEDNPIANNIKQGGKIC